VTRGRLNFGFGAEIVKKSLVLAGFRFRFAPGKFRFRPKLSVGFGDDRNRNWAHAASLSSSDEHLLPPLHSAQSFTPVSRYSGILGHDGRARAGPWAVTHPVTLVLSLDCQLQHLPGLASARRDRLSPVTRTWAILLHCLEYTEHTSLIHNSSVVQQLHINVYKRFR